MSSSNYQIKNSMKFFEGIRQNEYRENDGQLVALIDIFFEDVKIFVELSSSRLNDTRTLFRSLNRDDALGEYDCFKDLCLDFQSSLNEVKDYIEDIGQSKKLDKLLLTTLEIIEKTTQRSIKSKIPMPDIDYLRTNNVSESDIDWMLTRMKNFWVKFLQVYGSLRIDILLLN